MKIKELYEGDTLHNLYTALQDIRVRDTDEGKTYMTRIAGPEVFPDDLLQNWLTLNYLFCVDFDHEGKVIMGEIGGIIPTKDDEQIPAIAEASLSKASYGIVKVQEAKGDDAVIADLEKKIDMPVEFRAGFTTVSGNRNIDHYDFTTCAAPDNVILMAVTNPSLLFAAEGYMLFSNKQLRLEQYVFHIPWNDEIFDGMRGLEPEERLESIRERRDLLIPEELIAGFRIQYSKDAVQVRPLIAERDSKQSFQNEPVKTKIKYIGSSDAHGRFGIARQMFLV